MLAEKAKARSSRWRPPRGTLAGTPRPRTDVCGTLYWTVRRHLDAVAGASGSHVGNLPRFGRLSTEFTFFQPHVIFEAFGCCSPPGARRRAGPR
jgi:hypothetical protein